MRRVAAPPEAAVVGNLCDSCVSLKCPACTAVPESSLPRGLAVQVICGARGAETPTSQCTCAQYYDDVLSGGHASARQGCLGT